MLAKYDVILIGLSRWDNILNSSILNIAAEWSKTNRVFYIDRPFSLKDFFINREKRALKRKKALLFGKDKYAKVCLHNQEFIAVTPPLSLPLNKLPDGPVFDFFHKYNERLISKLIEELIEDFQIENYVFLNSFIPEFFDVIPPNGIQPKLKIYRSSDDISQEPYIAKHGIRKEKQAVSKADLVLVSSNGLKQKLSNISQSVFRVPNAARFDLFDYHNNYEKPPELDGISGKIIFLSGNISKLRINYNLIGKICEFFPENTLVVAGPYHACEIEENGLHVYRNIKWLGAVSLEKIAAIMAHSHCAIIPFLKNTLTKSIYPLKLNEYLAAGLPVVSTNFSSDLLAFAEEISLTESDEEFIQKIASSLSEIKVTEKLERRQKLAKVNGWDSRMDEILKLVEQKMLEKQGL